MALGLRLTPQRQSMNLTYITYDVAKYFRVLEEWASLMRSASAEKGKQITHMKARYHSSSSIPCDYLLFVNVPSIVPH